MIQPNLIQNDIIQEYTLYPKLFDYLKSIQIHSKRIDDKKSSKSTKGSNHWMFPDLVGLKVLSKNWDLGLKEFSKLHPVKFVEFWSFEVKVKIDISNAREYFFQAVSNSSWANSGYLVASEIDNKRRDEILEELMILSGLHGIGLIELNIKEPSFSKITIPAREKKEEDWNIMSRLSNNTDFSEYIKDIKEFCETGNIKNLTSNWDIK